MRFAALAFVAACSGSPKRPTPEPPPRVELARVPRCNLPPLPDPPTITVGFPTPDDVMVSKSDYSAMLIFVDGLRDWIIAASGCFAAQESFAGSLNNFLSGAR